MTKTGKDIDTLEAMLGPARADYLSLRHDAPLILPDTAARRRGGRRTAIAASVVILAGFAGLLAWDAVQAPSPTPLGFTRGALPDAPTTRPLVIETPRPSLAAIRPTVAFSMPSRPSGSNG